MSPRGWQERLYDIINAIAEIQYFLEDQSYETFKDDIKTQKAVELNFIVIGEAAARIPEEIEKTCPEIPWHFMRAMRNRLVHVYFEVDSLLVWETAHNDLPPLAVALQNILD